MKNLTWHRTLMAALLIAAGVAVCANVATTNVARGEVRGTPEPPTFQSRGPQTVPIFREISATLRQMDARLARLETVAKKMEMTARTPSTTAAVLTNPAAEQ